MFRSVLIRFTSCEFVPFHFYRISLMFVPFCSVPFFMNSFRSVSTKYWICSVSICSVPVRSVSTKYWLYYVSFCFIPFLFVSLSFCNILITVPFRSRLIRSIRFLKIETIFHQSVGSKNALHFRLCSDEFLYPYRY